MHSGRLTIRVVYGCSENALSGVIMEGFSVPKYVITVGRIGRRMARHRTHVSAISPEEDLPFWVIKGVSPMQVANTVTKSDLRFAYFPPPPGNVGTLLM